MGQDRVHGIPVVARARVAVEERIRDVSGVVARWVREDGVVGFALEGVGEVGGGAGEVEVRLDLYRAEEGAGPRVRAVKDVWVDGCEHVVDGGGGCGWDSGFEEGAHVGGCGDGG